MSYQVEITPFAQRQIKKLPPDVHLPLLPITDYQSREGDNTIITLKTILI